jgi:hypothetical protein
MDIRRAARSSQAARSAVSDSAAAATKHDRFVGVNPNNIVRARPVNVAAPADPARLPRDHYGDVAQHQEHERRAARPERQAHANRWSAAPPERPAAQQAECRHQHRQPAEQAAERRHDALMPIDSAITSV